MKRLLSLVLLFFTVNSVANESNTTLSIEEVNSAFSFANQKAGKGNFTQEKYFKVLNKPFVSKGQYSFDQQSFTWQTVTPIPSTVSFTNGKLVLTDEQGEKSTVKNGEVVVNVIKNIMTADFNALTDLFAFYQGASKACLRMVAKQQTLAKFAKEVNVCGLNSVDSVSLIDAQNNRTEITLTSR